MWPQLDLVTRLVMQEFIEGVNQKSGHKLNHIWATNIIVAQIYDLEIILTKLFFCLVWPLVLNLPVSCICASSPCTHRNITLTLLYFNGLEIILG